jgi:hypothetical protein
MTKKHPNLLAAYASYGMLFKLATYNKAATTLVSYNLKYTLN